ncbi:hypothetical protein J7I97_06100 [Streptomyces sp. ISL-87]|nr:MULTISPECIES: DUF5819 family protein [unclassified Streptomyces]MBT2404075.1 hypothetical protein [Streptomyces sp. ISL-21]MBT2607880.1 hypothetical protein [Streptomyces sp. ISL-87]
MVRRRPVGCQPLWSTLWTPDDRGGMDSNEREPADGAVPPPVPLPISPPLAPLTGPPLAPPPRAPGIAGLSAPYRVVAALALGGVAVAACWHLALVFLHVAPTNTVSRQHARTVDEWIYPEFEQNWKLFAPNPLQQNIAVEARAQLRTDAGELVTGDWRDLSADDGAAIRHNPLPSHTQQNELRRAWDFFTGSHDEDNKSNGERGELSERYLRRIAVNRLTPLHRGEGRIVRIQLRSVTRAVPAPKWSTERTDTETYYRELPWWTV